jgi:S1-C subfamily serine protease
MGVLHHNCLHVGALWSAVMLLGGQPVLAAGADPATLTDNIRPSVAYIIVGGGDSGSGVIAAVNGDRAYIVTAAHVVRNSPNRIKVIVGDDSAVELRGAFVAANAATDVAIITVSATPRMRAVTFGSHPPAGVALGALGYDAAARTRYEAGDALRALNARGTVGRSLANGRVAMSLPTEPGMSGGPVFDASGKVVGIVAGRSSSSRSTFEFIPASTVTKLLAENHVPYVAEFTRGNDMAIDDTVRSLVPLANVPNGGRVALAVTVTGKLLDAKNNQLSLDPVATGSRSVAATFTSQYLHAQALPASFYGDQVDQFTGSIRGNQAVGGVLVRVNVNSSSTIVGSTLRIAASALLMDAAGNIWSTGAGTNDKNRYFSFAPEEVASAAGAAVLQALSDMQARLGDATVGENFGRYGIPLGSGRRSAFVHFTKEGDVATVSQIVPLGTAARAGLQLHDRIVALNGRPIASWEQAQIDEVLTRPGRVDATVRGADGRDVVVSFRPVDIRSYLQTPAQRR